MRLSLCMIVRDEAFFIEDCLSAARPLVDEIVVVDTGSKDGTRETALVIADQIIDFPWVEDFSAARNEGLAAATGDWVLVLDADERIAPTDYAAMREAMHDERYDGFYLQNRSYSNAPDQRNWRPIGEDDPNARGYLGYSGHPIMKLFRSRADIRYRGRVHEIIDGSVEASRRGTLDVVIHHYGEANPGRPRRERALRYLKIMDEELAERDDGRLFAIAGSTAMYHAQDYAKAQRYLLRAAELGYEPAISLEGAAEAAYRAGDFGPARDIYERLYNDGKRAPSLCLNLANLVVRAGDAERGATLLEECLALGGIDEPTNEAIRRNIKLLRRKRPEDGVPRPS